MRSLAVISNQHQTDERALSFYGARAKPEPYFWNRIRAWHVAWTRACLSYKLARPSLIRPTVDRLPLGLLWRLPQQQEFSLHTCTAAGETAPNRGRSCLETFAACTDCLLPYALGPLGYGAYVGDRTIVLVIKRTTDVGFRAPVVTIPGVEGTSNPVHHEV